MNTIDSIQRVTEKEAKSMDSLKELQVTNAKLNWLRAAVLGANDGIVSVASIILGVAGATSDRNAIFTAGLAGLIAGALSMGLGEYVSVSSQRDTERAYIAKEKLELAADPEGELQELAEIYESKGLSAKTAFKVAQELSAHDVIKAHLDAELNISEDDLSSPTHAAIASGISFTAGALIPFVSVMLATTTTSRFVVTFTAVIVALFITGYLSATIGSASRKRAVLRVVVGGALAMIITYGIGHLFGTAVS